MKQLSGFVLVKETNSGVPNLIVTVYAPEGSTRDTLGERANRELCLEDLGRRIGSVVTDQNGAFSVESEHVEFQENESRPNLLLAVFAPEDVQDVKAPYPLPPQERILFISALARQDAGAKEAFVIRLLQKQLDHFQILSTARTTESNLDENRLALAIEGVWQFRDRLRNRLQGRLREEQENTEKLQRKAEEKTKHLSAIPKYLRKDGLINNELLINGKKELADNLKAKQDEVIASGLERLKTRKTVLQLRLTETELKELGLTVNKGQVSGKIKSERLSEKLGAVIKGVDLIRKRGLANPSPDSLIKQYLLRASVSPNGKEDLGSDELKNG